MHVAALEMLTFACELNFLMSKAYGIAGGDTK
jgi:hypothetical protein